MLIIVKSMISNYLDSLVTLASCLTSQHLFDLMTSTLVSLEVVASLTSSFIEMNFINSSFLYYK